MASSNNTATALMIDTYLYLPVCITACKDTTIFAINNKENDKKAPRA
jgi:hypothetical protein